MRKEDPFTLRVRERSAMEKDANASKGDDTVVPNGSNKGSSGGGWGFA